MQAGYDPDVNTLLLSLIMIIFSFIYNISKTIYAYVTYSGIIHALHLQQALTLNTDSEQRANLNKQQ